MIKKRAHVLESNLVRDVRVQESARQKFEDGYVEYESLSINAKITEPLDVSERSVVAIRKTNVGRISAGEIQRNSVFDLENRLSALEMRAIKLGKKLDKLSKPLSKELANELDLLGDNVFLLKKSKDI